MQAFEPDFGGTIAIRRPVIDESRVRFCVHFRSALAFRLVFAARRRSSSPGLHAPLQCVLGPQVFLKFRRLVLGPVFRKSNRYRRMPTNGHINRLRLENRRLRPATHVEIGPFFELAGRQHAVRKRLVSQSIQIGSAEGVQTLSPRS